jgi:hypothetical protein
VEDAELKQGVFTHFLVQGLQGAADQPVANQPGDGVITFAELSAYVANNTYAHVLEKYKIQQSPELRGDFDLNLPLARFLPKVTKVASNARPANESMPVQPPVGPVIQETFADVAEGELPADWICAQDSWRVQQIDTRRGLMPVSDKFAFLQVPRSWMPHLNADFELEIEFDLRGPALELILQQGAATRRLLLTQDGGGNLGGTAMPSGTRMFDADRPSLLRLVRKGDRISVFMQDLAENGRMNIVRQFRCSGPFSAIHIGLASENLRRSSMVTGVKLTNLRQDGVHNDPPETYDLCEERFLQIADGDFPEGWECAGGAIVTSAYGQPCLMGLEPTLASVKLPSPYAQRMTGEFVAEFDIFVSGGGSHDASAIVEPVAMFGKVENRFPVCIYRGALEVTEEYKSPAGTNFTHFMPRHSFCTVRLTRDTQSFTIGLIPLNGDTPIVIATLPANKNKVTELLLSFKEAGPGRDCRLYGLRVHSLANSNAIPTVTGTDPRQILEENALTSFAQASYMIADTPENRRHGGVIHKEYPTSLMVPSGDGPCEVWKSKDGQFVYVSRAGETLRFRTNDVRIVQAAITTE